VRDNADNTLALTAAVARSLETGANVEIPPQGAAMRVRLLAVKPEAIRKYGRMQLAAALAQWIAYQLSIWHEIATFYGASLARWPEKISAFSPEDLYSNQIGVRLAAGVILAKGARSDLEYALSMDAWIKRALERLGAVSQKDTRAAMRAVDGVWWDSEKRIPDWTLVRRRQFETDPYLRPWRIEDASPGTRGTPQPLARCRDAVSARAAARGRLRGSAARERVGRVTSTTRRRGGFSAASAGQPPRHGKISRRSSRRRAKRRGWLGVDAP
jgi:hypothetical protein